MEIIPSIRGGSKSCFTRGTCIPNMLPGTPISGGSVLNGQVQDAEEALASTLQNENPVPGQTHNHVPSDTSIKYSQTRNAMKDLASNTRDKPSQIFAQVVSQCDDNVQALLSRDETFKRTMRYQRPTPPVPATYADVRLP
jgi:hypothetical protein